MTASSSTSDPPDTRRVSWRARLAGLFSALIVAAFVQTVGSERFGRPVFDAWQRTAPRSMAGTPVRMVWIDDHSIRTIGDWPWPRSITAQLAEAIARGEPRVIGFDMLFAEPDNNAPERFAELYPELPAAAAGAVRQLTSKDEVLAGVVGGHPIVLGRAGIDASSRGVPAPLLVEAQFPEDLPRSVSSWPDALPNIQTIDDVAIGQGLLNGNPDDDGMFRRVPLVARARDTPMTGFALELARVAQGIDAVLPRIERGTLTGVRLGDRLITTDRTGSMRVPFGRPLPPISAADLLRGEVDPGTFKDAIVIVGLSGAGTADLVTTPVADRAYGASVHAAAVDAIVRGGELRRPAWAWMLEAGLAILLVGMAVRLLPRLSLVAAGASSALVMMLIMGASFLAYRNASLLLDPLGPLATGTAAGATMLVLLLAESRRQRTALAERLQEQRLQTARAQGELDAAREIQLGMLPPRDGLSGFDKAVELDALIEPARSVGGDFYDAIRLTDGRVCFLVGDVTGKGVPAALFMALSKALTKSVLLRDGADLGRAVARLNEEIARDNAEDMFVTMLFGVLDPATGRLELCNAGHENPLRIGADGTVETLKLAGGPPLAVAPGFPYEAEAVALAPGDAIVIVTDGITEAQNPEGDFFGTERLAAVLRALPAAAPLTAASDRLFTEVRAFEAGREPTDDLTVLAFRYAGAGAG